MESLTEGTAALPVSDTWDAHFTWRGRTWGGSGGGPELGEFPDGLPIALTPEQGTSEHETP